MELRFRSTAAGRFVAVLALTAGLALPSTITEGSSVQLAFNGYHRPSSTDILIPGLTGSLSLTGFDFESSLVAGQTATRVTFQYSLENTSTSPVLTSRISNLAFDTTPNILFTAPNAVTGTFTSVITNANQPNGIGSVEVCVTGANCPGGGGGGVTKGNTGTGTITLYFAGSITSFSIDEAYLRYQSVTCSAGSPCSGSASGDVIPGSDVPEPATYAMVGLACVALGVIRRRRMQS